MKVFFCVIRRRVMDRTVGGATASATTSRSAYEHLCVELVRYVLHRESASASSTTKGDAEAKEDEDAFDADRVKDACETLELIGARIGERLAELATTTTIAMDPFGDQQEAIMCACKEFWSLAHGRRVDKLKTNNRGTFVLHDDGFTAMRSVTRIARGGGIGGVDAIDANEDAHVRCALAFHAGATRGGLRALGVRATVAGEVIDPDPARSSSSIGPSGGGGGAPAPAVAFTVVVDEEPSRAPPSE